MLGRLLTRFQIRFGCTQVGIFCGLTDGKFQQEFESEYELVAKCHGRYVQYIRIQGVHVLIAYFYMKHV